MKKYFYNLVLVICFSSIYVSCTKDDLEVPISTNNNAVQTKQNTLSLVAEITTDNNYDRLELLDIGSVYESQWSRRCFENGEFQYEVICTKNVFDSEFSVLACDSNEVTIETDEGDIVVFSNIISTEGLITFDMERDNNTIAHYSFVTGQNADFVEVMRSFMSDDNSKSASIVVVGRVLCAVSPAAAVVVAAAALAYTAYRDACDRIIRNGERSCSSYGCGIWEGRCCVKCTGGNLYPTCNHIGAVYGNGSDCNGN